MGTSSQWPGPNQGEWEKASRKLSRLRRDLLIPVPRAPAAGEAPGSAVRSASQPAEQVGAVYLAALRRSVQADMSAFGLRDAMYEAGRRLIETIEALGSHGLVTSRSTAGHLAETRRNWFV